MEEAAMIKPTSKSELKRQCLMLSNLDVDKAEKMYDFLIKDITDIPDVEQSQKPLMQNIGEQAKGIFAWLRENKDMLEEGYGFIRSITSKKVSAPLPPINE